jgi:hypothetical protein
MASAALMDAVLSVAPRDDTARANRAIADAFMDFVV